MDANADDYIHIAKSCRDGPVFSNSGGDSLVCYGCDKPVHWVGQFERRRNGILHTVCGHFRHTKRAGGCNAETIDHRAAKHAVQSTEGWHFFVRCAKRAPSNPCCTQRFDVVIPNGQKKCELPFDKYFLDVGVLDESGHVVGAVEILHTHELSNEKCEALTEAGVAWVEVTSKRVLDAYKLWKHGDDQSADALSVQATNCAALLCAPCQAQFEIDEAAARERRIEEAATAKREARLALEYDTKGIVLHMNAQNTESTLGLDFWRDVVSKAAASAGVRMSTQIEKEASKTALEAIKHQSALIESLDRGSHRLNFGKYSGDTVEMVWARDPSYVRWTAGFTGYKSRTANNPRTVDSSFVSVDIREEARSLIKGKCYLCFRDTGEDWKSWCPKCYRDAVGA